MVEPPQRELTLRPDDRFPISYLALDDFGIGKSELMITRDDTPPTALALPSPQRDELLDDDPTAPDARRAWRGLQLVDLADIGAAGANG